MRALGRQLLVELHDCHAATLKKVDAVRDALTSAAKAARATIVGVAFHEFSPFGVSGVVIIAESHISIHTWPEHRYAALDIFTCGDSVIAEEIVRLVAEQFRCKSPTSMEVKRGVIPSADRLRARQPEREDAAVPAPSPA